MSLGEQCCVNVVLPIWVSSLVQHHLGVCPVSPALLVLHGSIVVEAELCT